jgi:hypothetical protein
VFKLLKGILAKIRPEPPCEPQPPLKVYALAAGGCGAMAAALALLVAESA